MADTSNELLDYSRPVASFLLLSPKGQFFALDGLLLARDFSRLVPRITSANLATLAPLAAKLKPSSVVLVLHPGERANAYFLTDVSAGALKKTVKIYQEPEDIVANAVENDLYPLIHLGEMQKAMALSKKNRAPLSIRIRFLELRAHVPDAWREVVRKLFVTNACERDLKADLLQERIDDLDLAIQRSMVDQYLSKCVWLDASTGQLGRFRRVGDSKGVGVFYTGDQAVATFSRTLDRHADGRYLAMKDFANVLPHLVKGKPWSSPTVHVYDPEIRRKHDLQEYYSLYEGLRAMSQLGCPVLTYEGSGSRNTIPVTLLRPSFGSDALSQYTAREFPIRDVVWPKPEA